MLFLIVILLSLAGVLYFRPRVMRIGYLNLVSFVMAGLFWTFDLMKYSEIMSLISFYLLFLTAIAGMHIAYIEKSALFNKFGWLKSIPLMGLFFLGFLMIFQPGIRLIKYISEQQGVFTVSYNHYRAVDNKMVNKPLMKGDVFLSEIKAKTNNLGSLSVRFKTFNRINDDVLVFRIRAAGVDEWHYENEYKVDQFQPDQMFPFGFPPIIDSKNQFFEYQIESTKGTVNNAVAVSGDEPILASKYIVNFRESELWNPLNLTQLAYGKFLNIVESKEIMDFIIKHP